MMLLLTKKLTRHNGMQRWQGKIGSRVEKLAVAARDPAQSKTFGRYLD